MWQDIEGRKKETHGRILLPSFMEQNLEAELLKMLAYFRWEKCRTGNGSAVEQLPLSIAYRRVYGLFAVLQKEQ